MSKPNRVVEIIQQANALDRRRQAQITNQTATINRLLLALDDGKNAGTSHAVYTEEMKTLFQAAAQLQVENQDLTAALRQLLEAVDRISPTGEIPEDLHLVADDARALIAPVSSEKGAAG